LRRRNLVDASGTYLFDGHVRADNGLQVPMTAGNDGIGTVGGGDQIFGPWYAW
jgi:hypothetical protein